MDIVKELQELIDEPAIGHDYVPIIERAIAEIRRLRSIAGPIRPGPSAADVMEPLRHRIQDGIEAEKALAAAYEADVKAFAEHERRRVAQASAQRGSVRAKLWD